MKELIDKEKKAIGIRIRQFRSLLSLTQSQLGKAAGISKDTIRSMEAGKGFTGDYLLAVSHFFSMKLYDFTNYDKPLPDELTIRSQMRRYHQQHRSSAYKILEEPPHLNAVIEFRLSKTAFLHTPRSVREIIDFCRSEYNLTFRSASVSQALKNAVDDRILKRIPKDGRNYLYQVLKKK
ncbi:helix-turn-helix transcriptional regulator [Compostibacter hankyongensis]|uniref:HTH cro/C1-type domain-containing protein n=1 Tax=Compostibacter hankyongensis TaxID=1007089 RepID=A0ABP8G198_9BACT